MAKATGKNDPQFHTKPGQTGLRAKVFVSCGQKVNTDESKIAMNISRMLTRMGFDPYVATDQNSLRSLRENIFSQLRASEYFLFIDFARETLNESPEHRGSLFSHQELAIASYLELDALAFQQKAVKRLDGMLSALQVNATPFDKPSQVSNLIRRRVQASWNPGWKNTLKISRDPQEFDDAYIPSPNGNVLARFFHLKVENLHFRQPALDCVGYVSSITYSQSNQKIPFRTSELKWAGYTMPTSAIMPRSHRELDACFVLHKEPEILHFNCFTDSSYFMRPIKGPGDLEVKYTVISRNFPTVESTVHVHIGSSLNKLKINQH